MSVSRKRKSSDSEELDPVSDPARSQSPSEPSEMYDQAYVLEPLVPFDVDAFDNETAQTTMILRDRELDLKRRYIELCDKLKMWISTGLHGELERAEKLLSAYLQPKLKLIPSSMVADRNWILEKEADLEERRMKIVLCMDSIKAAMQLSVCCLLCVCGGD